MNNRITFGVDQLISSLPADFRDGRWGLVTNDAATLASAPESKTRKALVDAGIPLVQLFTPEHGLTAKADDGQTVEDSTDALTGLPICSLYGSVMKPPVKILRELDGLLFDVPDVGARFYTYLWTLSHIMDACSYCDLKLVVLDRPNPLSGDLDQCEGPMLDTHNCRSYMGRAAMPIRYGLTIGEFARWLKHKWDLQFELEVIPVSGWNRRQLWPDTGLSFIPTSPSITSFDAALCYPGTSFFEATNLSAGRGTDYPFSQIGSPWLEPIKLRSVLRSYELPGVDWAITSFVPETEPYQGETCNGLRYEVEDPKVFEPVRTGLTMLAVIRRFYSSKFQWQPYPTTVNPTGKNHFELLIGQFYWRTELEDDPVSFIDELPDRLAVREWKDEVRPFLLYE